MDLSEVMASLRALVLVVENDGQIVDAYGGFSNVLDITPAELIGTSVFSHLSPEDGEDLANFLIEGAEEMASTAAQPLPFRLATVSAAGASHIVDVIPTGRQRPDGTWFWIVLIVPVELAGATTRSLDLAVSGASRSEVRRALCEELRVENDDYVYRWALIDLDPRGVSSLTVARDGDEPLRHALSETVERHDWAPWFGCVATDPTPILMEHVPDPLRTFMDSRGWQRIWMCPVYVDGELDAVFLMIGRMPDDYAKDLVKANLRSRIEGLVRTTAMLSAQWSQHDRLQWAARRDSLTGVANRDVFLEALEAEPRSGALLYVDVDHFKSVNDWYGHRCGDRVLVEVSERIVHACRHDDLVARFGGDEFVVLLRNAPESTSREIARRVVEAVGGALPSSIDGPRNVSVSVGLAMLDAVDDPLDAADAAMLAAKRSGRGRVELALA